MSEIKCTNCNNLLSDQDIFCPKCGNNRNGNPSNLEQMAKIGLNVAKYSPDFFKKIRKIAINVLFLDIGMYILEQLIDIFPSIGIFHFFWGFIAWGCIVTILGCSLGIIYYESVLNRKENTDN